MKDTSLVDLFELYDQAFDKVCDELNIKKRPTWQHRWFYRYLLINPIANFHHRVKRNKIEKLDKGIKGNKVLTELYNLKLEYSLSILVADKLDPSFYESFPEWYLKTMQDDERISDYKVDRIDFDCPGNQWINFSDREKEFKDWQKGNTKAIHKIYQSNAWDGYDIFAVPRVGDKTKILKSFKKILEINHRPSYNIVKNKVREQTVKDCYKLLEYRALNPSASLLEMAKETGVLSTSLAGIDGKYGENSSNSVKAGVHRLNDLALEILKDSSYSYFPLKGKYIENNEEAVQLVFRNYFKTKPYLRIQQIKDSLPTTLPSMVSKVRKEFKKINQ